MEDMNKQFRKLSEQNEAGETRRQALEKKVGGLSKVIAGKTSGALGTKRQTMEMGETKVENCVRIGNWREVPKPEAKIRHRISENCMSSNKVRGVIKIGRNQIMVKKNTCFADRRQKALRRLRG